MEMNEMSYCVVVGKGETLDSAMNDLKPKMQEFILKGFCIQGGASFKMENGVMYIMQTMIKEDESEIDFDKDTQKTEIDISQSIPSVEIDSDIFELASRLAEVTAERDELKKNARPVVCGEWLLCTERGIFGRKWLVCSNCESMNGTMIRFNFCPNCGARMRGTDENG